MRSSSHFYRSHILPVSHRSGATLVEVLMSLMIFSIGIVSVFTLFPVSLLSSIQATKLTNSKILADNVVERLRTDPSVLRPHLDLAWNWRGEWQPQTQYSMNDVVWPQIKPGELLPVPPLVYRCTMASGNRRTDSSEPTWPKGTTGSVTDNNVNWVIAPWANAPNYIVDPMGRHVEGDDTRRWFGYEGGTTLQSGTAMSPALRRSSGGVANYNSSLTEFSQPDTWTTVLEEIPTAVTSTTVTFPNSVELGGVSTANHRLVFISNDGKRSTIRFLAASNPISGQVITLNTSETDTSRYPLTTDLDSVSEISKVRIESFTPRYSYMLSVRRPNANVAPTVNAIIMFNRDTSPDAEEIYEANFASNDEDPMSPSGFSGSTPINGILDNDVIRVAWDLPGTGEREPLIREGNYILDAKEAFWYRIVNVGSESTVGGKRQVDLTVDRPIEVRTPATGNASDAGRAILMPGIVEIFKL